MDTRKGVGTFIGLFMGAGLGVVVFFVLPGDEECSPSGDPFLTECVAEETASVVLRALGTVLFTIVGAVAGYQIGSLIEVEKWEVAWERRSRLSLHPSASPSQMAAGGPTLVINF